MMAVRLVELHRVLKPTGSLYLHCDPTASHYLKLVLDAVFGPEKFVNEIIWKRSHAHSDARQGAKHFGRLSDTILFYSKSEGRTWNVQYVDYDESYVDRDYRRVDKPVVATGSTIFRARAAPKRATLLPGDGRLALLALLERADG